MASNEEQKIKYLAKLRIPGVPLLASYLAGKGFSHKLQQYYSHSGWLERIGYGAYCWPGDELDWQGVVYSLQAQLDLSLLVGAQSALALTGSAHYLRTDEELVFLFSSEVKKLPGWVMGLSCCRNLALVHTEFLSEPTLGVTSLAHKSFAFKISSPERSILETLYLTPQKIDYLEVYQIFESLTTLRPQVIQVLLESCHSIKVKRLFCLLAQQFGYAWNKQLKLDRLNFGKGVRSLSESGGVYVPEYQLVIPAQLWQLFHSRENI